MVDEQTYTEVSAALLPSLYRISMSILHSHPDAQDAVQQALLKAWAGRQKAYPTEYRAYLTRITINECRNIQRYRVRVQPTDAFPEEAAPESRNTELWDAIARLPEKLRTVLLLKYMEQYAEREVAQALGISVAAVKNRLYRARKEMQKLFAMEVTFE